MYKVLKEVVEDTTTGTRSNLEIGTGGRVRDPNLKAMVAKQLNVAMGSLESQPQMDLKTGRIASKKAKKEQPAEKVALKDLKTMANKLLVDMSLHMNLNNPNNHLRFNKAFKDIPSCLDEMSKYGVRNSADLESWLGGSSKLTVKHYCSIKRFCLS